MYSTILTSEISFSVALWAPQALRSCVVSMVLDSFALYLFHPITTIRVSFPLNLKFNKPR